MSAVLQEPGVVQELSKPPRRGGFLWQVIKERPAASVGATIVSIFILLAVLAPWVAPYGLHQQVGPVYGHPSAKHWLGLDDGGVDMVTLLIWGARISLLVGFAATLVSTLLGGGIGIVAGYFGGATDSALMRLTDYFLVIPDVPLMIVVAAVWGPSLSHIILVIGLLLWTSTARVIRSQVKSVRERVYLKRARSLGAGNLRIIFRHILPQIAPLLIANVVLTVAVAIFDETALAFLGLGDPSKISWGKLIENAFERTAISAGAWWAIVPPGVAVALVIMGCSLLGSAIEDALNPRLKVAHLSVRRFRLRPLVGRDEA
ncbi:MAG: ABC transporter permease [Actinomycetota bacterium]|nr:ABC transporter permease [Actinomycetota bacterium]